MSGSPLEAVAQAIDDAIWLAMGQHEPLKNDSVCTCGVRNNMDGDVLFSHRYSVVSDAANAALTKGLAALELREETRTNAMSSAGMTVDSKTGEVTHHSDIRYDRRWVSSWTSGSEG